MLTIFTVADRTYEPFIVPYILSSLYHNPETWVEVGVENVDAFNRNNGKAIDKLRSFGLINWSLRDVEFSCSPNKCRFLYEPTKRSKYVYIGDIDILILQEICPFHIAQMNDAGLPYSNIVRVGSAPPRMSGLHFSRWDAMYPLSITDSSNIDQDEIFLYESVLSKGHSLPPSNFKRPQHGLHLSLWRAPAGSKMSWAIPADKGLVTAYVALRATDLWREVVPLLDRRYRALLTVLDSVVCSTFPELSDGAFLPATRLHDIWAELATG